jgi:hypothetical protein
MTASQNMEKNEKLRRSANHCRFAPFNEIPDKLHRVFIDPQYG